MYLYNISATKYRQISFYCWNVGILRNTCGNTYVSIKLSCFQDEPTQGDSGTWAAAAKLLDYILTSALLLTVLVIACIYIFS